MTWLSTEELNAEIPTWLSNWPQGIIALDKGHKIIWLSKPATELLGWQQKDIAESNVHQLLCVNSRSCQHDEHQCPLAKNNADDTIYSTFWYDKDGFSTPVDYQLIYQDGSEKTVRLISFVCTEDDAHDRAELNKLSAYVDRNPSPVAELDGNGQLGFGNPALQSLLLEHGFDQYGKAHIFPDDIEKICQHVFCEHASYTNIEKNIESHWFAWHFYPLAISEETSDDNIVSVMAYGTDITKQKKAEQKAKEERANARRDFYAKMMHELRTPLNAIVGFSDLLLARNSKKLDKRDQHSLKTIKTAGVQLGDLITDTLDIAKIEAGKMSTSLKEFDLKDVVNEINDQMNSIASGKNLNYKSTIESGIRMHSDQVKIRQILVNLISNGIKYSKQGHVLLGAKRIESPSPMAEITVSDTGVGIPEDQIAYLFDAYQRVGESEKTEIQGTGLGLALVQELVTLLGGEISVSSELGVGSTFSVKLPLILTET